MVVASRQFLSGFRQKDRTAGVRRCPGEASMRTYEELNGAGGREIFYRAERFKAADVFKRGTPNILIDDELCTLHDLSLTGLSTIGRMGANHLRHVGQRVAVQFEICNIALFAGDGEIV